MTPHQTKSIEDTILKISLRSLWYLLGSVIVATGFAYSCYMDLKHMNEQILARLDRLEQSTQYKIEASEREIGYLKERIVKLEK